MIKIQKKIFLPIIILLLEYFQIFAGQQNFDSSFALTKSDSLKTLLTQESIDTVKVNLLNEIAWYLAPTDYSESIKYAEMAKKLSSEVGFEKGIGDAYNIFGEIYRYKGDIKLSIENHNYALSIFKNLHLKEKIAKTKNNIGMAYYNVSDFKNSLQNFESSLQIYQELKIQEGIGDNLGKIGILLSTFKKYESALEYFKSALKIYEETNNQSNIAVQLGNIGLTYFELKDYKLSNEYYNNALAIFKKIEDKYNYSVFLGNIGLVCAEQNKFSEALMYYKNALKIANEINDNYGIAYLHGNIGRLKIKIFNVNKKLVSEEKLNEILNEAKENYLISILGFRKLGMIDEEKTHLLYLAELYKINGNYKSALENFSLAKILQDSLNNSANKKMIAELEIKQQLESKENEILLLNEENEKKTLIAFGLFGFFFIGFSTAIIIYVFYRKKQKQNKLLLETEKNLRSKKIQLEIYQGQLEQLVFERTQELESEIKERKKIEKDLVIAKETAEAASNSKSVFLANMSHELRTPLVGILGYSDLMRNMIEDPDLKEMAEGINRTGNRLLSTLSLVLDLARLESDMLEINLKPIDIIQEIKETCTSFRGALSNKKLGFDVNLHTDSFMLDMDQSMFRVILENLINNAFKFTSNGEIRILTSIENDLIDSKFVIKVQDTGIGIKKDQIPLIFKEFKQLSEGFTKDFQGSGLGLAITKKYIELLGGNISVESEFGKGTTFIISFAIKIQSAA
ncbi:MAG: tetratricopeptide repeat-containing sensor histidine kinase [Ignavibacteriae bacterium]|nr:tetratricopeptide repeat-containing sensor histidine kinase [Ignavibacteriota bacterium]